MTWEQYLKLNSAADALIAQLISEYQPLGGSGAVVQGMQVGLNGYESDQDEARETWELVIWGRARGSFGETAFDTGWEVAATLPRALGQLQSTYFWGRTQLYQSGEDARTFDLSLAVETFSPGIAPVFGQGVFRLPVRLELELVKMLFTPEGDEAGWDVVQTISADLRRAGWSRLFSAPTEDEFYELRPAGIAHS